MFDSATAYDRFMGRYSVPLAEVFVEFAAHGRRGRVLDVGSGPGALTGELVRILGADQVSAIDPSESFITALRTRYPGVEAQVASAEALPYETGVFDIALSQLVVHFMSDPVAGLSEMRRVTRSGGLVAACVWDLAGGKSPLSLFWAAAKDLDADVVDESKRAGTARGQLGELFREAGIHSVEEQGLTIRVEHGGFDEWWEPFGEGVGPAGSYVAGLSPAARDRLRELCRERIGTAPIVVDATAWAARGIA